jgi:hypothetical protein
VSGFVFDHYVPVAQITIASILPLMLVAVLITRKTGRLRACALAFVAYIAVVALGMSSDIKHLSPIGIAHALIAFAIAVLAARRLSVRAGWLLLVPCLLMLVVVLFNLANDDVGLELMGRWNRSG